MTKQEAIEFLCTKPYRLGHKLGFRDLTELNNEWIVKMVTAKDSHTLQAHRGSYKTTCVSISLALLILLFPQKKILFLRKTDTDVREVVEQVKKILKSDYLQVFSDTIWGIPLSLTVDNQTMIDTSLNTYIKGGAQLTAFGCKGSITGKHYDIIFTDDIVNLDDRISKAEREHTLLVYQELQNVVNKGGRFFNTGTPWHKDDCFTIMPNIERYDCYSTGLLTADEIKQKRASMTDSLFSANYELKHIADVDALFRNPQFESDPKLIYDGRAHIDASYGGTDGTAFTIVNKLNDGTIVVLGKLWQKHVDDCINEILFMMNSYRAGTVICEKNADKGYLRQELAEAGLFAKTYHERMNKYVKIATYLKGNWDNVHFLDGTDPEYVNQILDYNEHAQHDDAPDSLASLLRDYEQKAHYNKVVGGI